MKSFIIAWKDFMIRIKDRRGFTMMILMPLILTAILGFALSGVMGEGSTAFPETTIGVVIPDEDPLAGQFIDDVLQSEDLKPYINIENADSKKVLAENVRDGSIDAGLVFPKGWSGNLKNGKLKDVTLLTDPGKDLQSNILQSMINTFTSRVQTVAVSTNTILSQPVSTGEENLAALAPALTKDLQEAASQQLQAVNDQSTGKKPVSGMQYYAAAMAAMFLLFNIMVGAKSFIDERDSQTLARILSTPTTKTSVLFGKFLGTLYYATAQFFIFMTATHFLFSVDWGSNILQTLAVGISFAVSVSGLSMLIASAVKTEKTADIIGGVGVQILAVLGGSMIPITVFPELLRHIAHIAPNTWALTSFIDIMSGTSWQTLFLPIGVLTLIGLAATLIGTWRLQAR